MTAAEHLVLLLTLARDYVEWVDNDTSPPNEPATPATYPLCRALVSKAEAMDLAAETNRVLLGEVAKLRAGLLEACEMACDSALESGRIAELRKLAEATS